PATVIVTLTASLFMALIFVPVIGTFFSGGRSSLSSGGAPARSNTYQRIVDYMIARPGFAIGLSLLLLLASTLVYGALGRGVEFFPAVEPERAQVQIK